MVNRAGQAGYGKYLLLRILENVVSGDWFSADLFLCQARDQARNSSADLWILGSQVAHFHYGALFHAGGRISTSHQLWLP